MGLPLRLTWSAAHSSDLYSTIAKSRQEADAAEARKLTDVAHTAVKSGEFKRGDNGAYKLTLLLGPSR